MISEQNDGYGGKLSPANKRGGGVYVKMVKKKADRKTQQEKLEGEGYSVRLRHKIAKDGGKTSGVGVLERKKIRGGTGGGKK